MTMAGGPDAATRSGRDYRLWHLSDLLILTANVGYEG